MEYVDGTDELAYIASLEQQNKELRLALAVAIQKTLIGHTHALTDENTAWQYIHQAEDVMRLALQKVRK